MKPPVRSRRTDASFHPSLPQPIVVAPSGFGNEPDHLRGLKQVPFLVVGTSPESTAIGLTKSRVEETVAATLRRHRVPLASDRERDRMLGHPLLVVAIQIRREAYGIDVRLQEDVRLERDPRFYVVGATVWEIQRLGTHTGDAGLLLKAVEESVATFCIDYGKSHPTKP